MISNIVQPITNQMEKGSVQESNVPIPESLSYFFIVAKIRGRAASTGAIGLEMESPIR